VTTFGSPCALMGGKILDHSLTCTIDTTHLHGMTKIRLRKMKPFC